MWWWEGTRGPWGFERQRPPKQSPLNGWTGGKPLRSTPSFIFFKDCSPLWSYQISSAKVQYYQGTKSRLIASIRKNFIEVFTPTLFIAICVKGCVGYLAINRLS
ncbi:hypothetical protein BDV28DRAFT_138206 [Aspergillus coremiiformis]|uniref:Uncharacterized protein n=1 Tax=Aspergillus coremiiformis TaxID=138285 RepID=A0A5N6YZT5_9EURO|nr:hypothetical protein BDV28DRAFT_138206 [Aspergillus coremiiformis]